MTDLSSILMAKPVIGAIRTGILSELSRDLLSLPPAFFLLERDINTDLFVIEQMPPLICGGFIRSSREVMTIVHSGAQAVSTSATELWALNREANLGEVCSDD